MNHFIGRQDDITAVKLGESRTGRLACPEAVVDNTLQKAIAGCLVYDCQTARYLNI